MKGAIVYLCGVLVALLLASSPAMAGETITYSYDALGRLVATSTTGTVNNGQAVTTSFDPAGNRTNYTVSGANALISVAAASVTEGGTLSFVVTRSGNTAGSNSVSYASANGTAVAPGDYTAVSGTVTFAANETAKTISVATVNDTAPEANETLTLTLSAPTGGAVLGTALATGTINDNDSANLAIASASITEGGTLSFTVTRSGVTTSAVSASYATASGTATSGSDFTAKTGTVSFAANVTTATITVTTTDDTAVESAETMTVNLSSPSAGAAITTAIGTGTINDNDTPPANLVIGNAGVTEGGTLAFTVTRSGTTTTAVSASYASAGGTATSGSDFTAASGTVSFAANETSKTVSVGTIDDAAVESAESMTVTLSAPSSGATITGATGTGTIADNDSLIVLADSSRNVLPAHATAYGCSMGAYEGSFWDLCWLNASGIYVWEYWSSPQLDPGYSFNALGELQVQSGFYGTGVAP